jgi:hypothetical protein
VCERERERERGWEVERRQGKHPLSYRGDVIVVAAGTHPIAKQMKRKRSAASFLFFSHCNSVARMNNDDEKSSSQV